MNVQNNTSATVRKHSDIDSAEPTDPISSWKTCRHRPLLRQSTYFLEQPLSLGEGLIRAHTIFLSKC